ncbi:4-hydroxy-tetrahydrodipicolinate synthase [Myxococcota bacterium]|nr:4-hydroxy-tetrahydrodipicolinate synthase [Myxococcota bacterium]MBU1382180.1 4-hydroxy-tetrahydrodipicolinate synthase [Myxococcota bacterium]MBU1498730.1 4-hydroxy-tetrahydrodipicolinate synthase [Myxococcota bacterium]
MLIKGSIVAVVTPFLQGKLDNDSFLKLINYHLENETDGIVVCGTTGEAATLSDDEFCTVVKNAADKIGGRIPLIVGTGMNDTEKTIVRTRLAAEYGAQTALVVTPYYNKPGPEGLARHFTKVADSSPIPVILYNVPGRTGINMSPSVVSRLYEHKNIIAIKEASGNVGQAADILKLCPGFPLLSGDDKINLPLLAIGGQGAISVVANLVPKEFHKMFDCWSSNSSESLDIYYKYLRLCDLLFIETSPAPVKYALMKMGLIKSHEVRLPLSELSNESARILENELEKVGII